MGRTDHCHCTRVTGTVAEGDLDVFFETVELALVEIVGKDSLGADALSKAFQSAVWASGIKRKIMNIGNGKDVADLARYAHPFAASLV